MTDLIGLDWGTSSLRAYLMDGDGQVRDTRSRPWGIRHLPDGGFDAALRDIVADWPEAPRLAAGMVGSRNGWREVPYLDLPTGAEAIATALSELHTADGGVVHLVPGLRNPRGPDVMRGEETQILGAIALRPALAARSTLLLPGTHSKWVSVRNGVVFDFMTMMTGELFAVLRNHSILGAGLPAEAGTVTDSDAFRRGVRTARDTGAAGVTTRLFSARSLMLDGQLDPAAVPDYLSGLLIGEELRAALAVGRMDASLPIQPIGDEALCARYRYAATEFDLTLSPTIHDASAQGLWRIAAAAGQLS
ncbi:MAG TPA: 2-dehydro-3-deoxygalactonokinase [Luteibacter sp.]|nr:2-dehydro-3-deoxygalactonokinase [Luteibacter sp.]